MYSDLAALEAYRLTEIQTRATLIHRGVSQVLVMAVYGSRPPTCLDPRLFFDLIKRKRVHQFQLRGGEMTVHKLKVSISLEQGGGRSIINMEDNSVCNVTRLETLLSFRR